MVIRVMYDDGRFGMVKPYLLDKLLEQKKVTGFLRLDGWVAVGRDTLRSRSSPQDYAGLERRNCDGSSDPFGRDLLVRILPEVAWIAGVLILVSILFSGLL